MRFSRSDALVTLVVVILSLLLGLAYYQELHRVFQARDAQELGIIVFRRRSATRRPGDSLRWGRLSNESPVYQGDVIRTAGLSEAGIHFEDGTSLDILENSMVALNFDDMLREFEFLGGTIFIGGDREAARNVRVRMGDTVVEASADARVAVSADGNELSVDVADGQADVLRETGERDTVLANSTYVLNTATGEASTVAHTILPQWPRQNSRLVHQYQAVPELRLQFELAEPVTEDLPVVVEISREPGFAELQAVLPAELPAGSRELVALPVELPVGQWYWRVRSRDQGRELQSPVRRFRVLHSELPRPLRPLPAAELGFRRQLPQVRFAWSSVADAGGYILELARDAAFTREVQRIRSVHAGIAVPMPGEGDWYWRVSPILPYEYLHAPGATTPRVLTVQQQEAMQPLQAGMPADATLFEIQQVQQSGLAFSWQPEREAQRYQLLLSREASPDPDDPGVVRQETRQPFARVAAEALGEELSEQAWYWGVRWQDAEGSWSPPGEFRRLNLVDGEFALRLVYPPGGFRIADSLAATSRFTWSSNIDAPTVFQLAEDPLFQQVVFEHEVSGDSLFGRSWEPGEYFWRMRTYNVDGSVFLDTPPREVQIVPPLDRSELRQPAPGQTHMLVDGDTLQFRWEPVPQADYYRFQLFRPGSSTPVYDEGLLGEPAAMVALGDMPDGAYRAVIQGFALASEESTRVIGYRAEFPFTSHRLSPVELQQPADGQRIDGLTALRSGVRLSWDAADVPDELSIELLHNGEPVPVDASPRRSAATVGRLRPGRYVWRAAAELQGFDLSSRGSRSFIVDQVPPMREPQLQTPQPDSEFGPQELAGRDSIRFRWESLDAANRYIIGVYRADSGEAVVPPQVLEEAAFELDDLSRLSRGEFRWEVQGQYRADDGYLEQDGLPAEGHFRIVLPELMIPAGVREAELYGR
ncbi:FecR domain-containing protein [Spirochaeta africana]|uniref:FecR protein n=1 Tax=Spirochaeta africana (strain ATCC 700263 / DSM 8902 / Z-7692) TaxID=889378 RepID=H9UGD2_SPIAZ|nr:FecR domain-containing protein [Spirochaeta africana]AFG36575.1 FecR protein [Spirochaeta africana DSM 8902]